MATLLVLPLAAAVVQAPQVAAVLDSAPVVRLLGPVTTSTLWTLCAAFAPGRRVFLALLLSLAAGLLAGHRLAPDADDPVAQRRFARWMTRTWLLAAVAAVILLRGAPWLAGDVLAYVPPQDWGGLLLTVVLSVAAIAASFPLGVLLALGRRSSLPLVKTVAVTYIELIRGVPLVTVLFMAQIMVPLVLPEGPWLDRVFRAIVGLALFFAAYVAEDVRGGLAAVGRGQEEAGQAVGLGTGKLYRLVVLPQALRVVVPSLVGQFISLFKDTSLTAIVGLNELLGVALLVVAQPEWLGSIRESLLFVAVVYFVLSAAMVRVSRRLEARAR